MGSISVANLPAYGPICKTRALFHAIKAAALRYSGRRSKFGACQ